MICKKNKFAHLRETPMDDDNSVSAQNCYYQTKENLLRGITGYADSSILKS